MDHAKEGAPVEPRAPLAPLSSGPIGWDIPCCGPHPVTWNTPIPKAGGHAVWDGTGWLPICDKQCLPIAMGFLMDAVFFGLLGGQTVRIDERTENVSTAQSPEATAR